MNVGVKDCIYMLKKIDEIIGRVFQVAVYELDDNMGMDDIATWDSLVHMNLITTLEAELGIFFSGDEIADMQTVGTIRSIVVSAMTRN